MALIKVLGLPKPKGEPKRISPSILLIISDDGLFDRVVKFNGHIKTLLEYKFELLRNLFLEAVDV
jgi:hypothetical protein